MEKIFKMLIICSLIFSGSISSCQNEEISLKGDAEIIGFTADKCMCCWGWTIKIGNDTIKSDNIIISDVIGIEPNYPVKVNIELGKISQSCSDGGYTNPDNLKDYYEIKRIEKVE